MGDQVVQCSKFELEIWWNSVFGWNVNRCIINSLRSSDTYAYGSDNGLLHGWHQAIIWINAGILLIGPKGTNSLEFQ